MYLARLDNEVFFKKAFTDPIVFKAFVKDILGIDIEPDSIETEKAFQPKLGNINFKYDIFAEDTKNRIIVEIQKVEYDHNFDRFLHYHLQAITEQQRSSDDYSVPRTVYTIVVITAPYKRDKETGEWFKDDVLISNLNPKNLKGLERQIFNHKLVFLNPNYKDPETPTNYRDWLELIDESIHNSQNVTINSANEGVKRAASIVSYEQISPEEWEQSKIEVGKKKVLEIQYEKGFEEGIGKGLEQGAEKRNLDIAKQMKAENESLAKIIKYTGLSKEEIENLS